MRSALICMMALVCSTALGAQITVDCAQANGTIRPLHGANGGPLMHGEFVDLSARFRELGFPFLRLHDCQYPNPAVVDIHAVFPNFAADPASPDSYDFRRTDDYLQSILEVGSRIYYRLGQSIEHTRVKYRVHPPPDAQKWADICAGIIRHYTQGWANGFDHDILYWEIWNEPENRPACWTGTDEQFLALYEAAAVTIKRRFPALKVGGPGFGHTGSFREGRFEPAPLLKLLLERCRDRAIPLDFLSWHLYTNDPLECVTRAKALRSLLDAHGLMKTELHLNEWNYLPDNDWGPCSPQQQGPPRDRFFQRIASAEGAAFDAAVLINMQDSPIDQAMYYNAENHTFGALFTFNGTPTTAFYAFKSFVAMLATPERLRVTGGDGRGVAALAGINRDRGIVQVLLSSREPRRGVLSIRLVNLPWNGPTHCEVHAVDSRRSLEESDERILRDGPAELELPASAPAVFLVRLRRAP